MLEQEYKKYLIVDDDDTYQNRDEVKNMLFMNVLNIFMIMITMKNLDIYLKKKK